jgi:Flagellar hook-length control protein FliK
MSITAGPPGLTRKSIADSLGAVARAKPDAAEGVDVSVSSAFSSVLTSIALSTDAGGQMGVSAQLPAPLVNAGGEPGGMSSESSSVPCLLIPDAQWLVTVGVACAPTPTLGVVPATVGARRAVGGDQLHVGNGGGIDSSDFALLRQDQQGISVRKSDVAGAHAGENDPERVGKPDVLSGTNGDGKLVARLMVPVQTNDMSGFARRLAELPPTSGNSGGMSNPPERPQDRSSPRSLSGPIEGLLAGGNYSPGIGVQSSATLSNSSVGVQETAVAEQVKYWVSQQVQNAELKLDGFGKDPVEVSISLSGNEARVEFRSDQVATRDVLEGAISQLKELLESEGLQLSSVSVGSSGHNRSGSNESRHASEGRIATVVNATQPAGEVIGQSKPSSVRVLDLFV